jgi:hypothetical protein
VLEEFIIHLKNCGSQTNFQELHDVFDLQDRPFHQCVVIIKLLLMTCRASSIHSLVKRLTWMLTRVSIKSER